QAVIPLPPPVMPISPTIHAAKPLAREGLASALEKVKLKKVQSSTIPPRSNESGDLTQLLAARIGQRRADSREDEDDRDDDDWDEDTEEWGDDKPSKQTGGFDFEYDGINYFITDREANLFMKYYERYLQSHNR